MLAKLPRSTLLRGRFGLVRDRKSLLLGSLLTTRTGVVLLPIAHSFVEVSKFDLIAVRVCHSFLKEKLI